MVPSYRTWLEISGAALRYNLRSVATRTRTPIMPIVKANAYGHGTREVLQALRRQPVWGYGVAYGSEALELRQLGWRGRVVALSFWQPTELTALVNERIDFVVWDQSSLNEVLRLPVRLRRRARVHVKLDTGTTRIGFLPHEIASVRQTLKASSLRVYAVFSHFANAEAKDGNPTLQQIQRFTTLRDMLHPTRGIVSHIACTAAAVRFSEAKFGLLRLGIGLYGLWPSPQTRAAVGQKTASKLFRPVMTWKTSISQVKRVPRGTAVGYGGSMVTKRTTKVGIIPVGYSDGYDRRLSNCGWVMINGRRVPLLGRVCMNLTMVDVTRIPGARVGTPVTLLGPGVTADDLADTMGTIHYEVTTRIVSTIPRVLV